MDTTTTIATAGRTGMDDRALYRLMAWLSPGYPVGAFAYSHGIEWAVEDGSVTDEASLTGWTEDILRLGGGWTDAVLFAHAWRAGDDGAALADLNALAEALAPSVERRLETMAQGTAFMKATLDAWPWPGATAVRAALGAETAYPIAVAAAAAGHGAPLEAALPAYLHGFAANLVSAGVRLVPLGQSAGQRALAYLETPVREVAAAAADADLAALGGIAIVSDIAAMKHETQYTRLFRS